MSRITATYAFDGTGYIEGCHVRVEEQVNVHGERSEHVVLESKGEVDRVSQEIRPACARGFRRLPAIGREREEG